ncbi:MAG: SDR family oxidoreductase [Anaerolineales bacterium]
MARVLITGGAGFIGSHLTEELVKRGDQVRVLDNFSTGKLRNLADVKDKIELIRGDLRNHADVQAAVSQVDVVFHQAAFVSVPKSIEDPRDCYEININGTVELMEAARQAGVSRVVLASSAAVYGSSTGLPLNESALTRPLSPYAASKLFAETLAQLYSAAHNLTVVALRYFNVYGPRQSPSSQYAAAIPKFIHALKTGQAPLVFGDGTQTRDFIYVSDAVRANLLAAEAAGVAGKAFNICSGAETSLLDLLKILYAQFPQAPQPEFSDPRLGDVPRSLGDPSLAARALGFRPEIALAEGLKRCVSSGSQT